MQHSKALKLVLSGLVFVTVFAHVSTVSAGSSEYRKCNQGTSCIIGEFLYDDSYSPIATATCNFTSRYPDGTIFVNSGSMDVTSDGWYSYSVEATGSAGLYRSQVCCNASGDYLCLDKSFMVATTSSTLTKTDVSDAVWNAQRSSYTTAGSFGESLQNIVPSGSQIADAVWGYSGRTLSGFGSLPSDIWSSSSRTLSSFGDLVSSIWSGKTDTSLLATKTDIAGIKKNVDETRLLLEKTINKPIIQNSLEEKSDIDLQSKLDQTQTTLTELFINSYSLDGKLGLIDLYWKDLDSKTLISRIGELTTLNAKIQAGAKKIKEGWNLELANSMNAQADSLNGRLHIVQNELTSQGKSQIVYDDVQSLRLSLNAFIDQLGSSSDKVGTISLFAKIKEIRGESESLDLFKADVDKLLTNWKSYSLSDIQKRANLMAENLTKISKVPNAPVIFSSSNKTTDSLDKKLKNKLLSMKGAVEANRKLLARQSDKPFSSGWLEEGSIIFKMLLTNPSTLISQDVPLQYCLPTEIKKENIISVDEGLEVNYDLTKKQLCVSGQFTLAPDESKTVSVRVEDIWFIPEDQIESLRRQTAELAKPLANTSYFGQGVTIKSNIDVTLDKLLSNLKSAVTPEAKLKTYYETKIEIEGVKEQITKLQELVTQAGSVGSLTGFVGGSQAVAVWGLIIIMGAGFVFLVLYMRTLRGRENESEEKPIKAKKLMKKETGPTVQGNMIRFASIFFILGAISSVGSGLAIYKTIDYFASSKNTVQVAAKTSETIISPIPPDEGRSTNTAVLGVTQKKIVVTVQDLSGNYLRVRGTPNGKEIARAKSGETYTFIQEEKDWTQVELPDGIKGWVSSNFISKSD